MSRRFCFPLHKQGTSFDMISCFRAQLVWAALLGPDLKYAGKLFLCCLFQRCRQPVLSKGFDRTGQLQRRSQDTGSQEVMDTLIIELCSDEVTVDIVLPFMFTGFQRLCTSARLPILRTISGNFGPGHNKQSNQDADLGTILVRLIALLDFTLPLAGCGLFASISRIRPARTLAGALLKRRQHAGLCFFMSMSERSRRGQAMFACHTKGCHLLFLVQDP